MNTRKWGAAGLAVVMLVFYNAAQPDLRAFRNNQNKKPGTAKSESYGPSLVWLDKVMAASSDREKPDDEYTPKLDFRVLSSLMVAGLASGFKSQVANLLWMKSDEYWHKGLLTRQNPLMELVVTLDPQFIEAWSTAGWHWAYNIYADIELNPKYKNNPKLVRAKQEMAIKTGLDYLRRGSEMNPDRYRLWFEHGWTRAEKAGYYDEETVALYRKARAQKDARLIEKEVTVNGKPHTTQVQGLDIIGRTIGHLYERQPDFDKALDIYGNDLLKATPEERALLDAAGDYWHRYGSDYPSIVNFYQDSDASLKAQVRALIPDIDRMVEAQKMRLKMQGVDDQPTGAYVSITARYMPAWKLYKAGKYDEAAATMVGVMNADPKYHLQGLPTVAKIYALRGDGPAEITKELQGLRDIEKQSSQDLGLHFLAKIYEAQEAKATNPQQKKAFARLAYNTWYRSRERDSLDFYARRNTFKYEDKYGFTPPKDVIDEIKASRKKGTVNAAPAVPPNVEQYYGQ